MVQRMKWASLHLGSPPSPPPIILENIFFLPGRLGGVVMFLFNLVMFLWSPLSSFIQGATGILLVKILTTAYQTLSKLKQMSFLPLLLFHVFLLVMFPLFQRSVGNDFPYLPRYAAATKAVYYNFYTLVLCLSLGSGN